MRKLFLIISLFGLFSCAEEKQKIPAGLLPPAKLTSILADIHIAEAQVEQMRLSPDTAKVIFDQLQREVLKKRGVSEKQFNKTYTYYLNNLNALDKIYESLVDTLNMREVHLAATTGVADSAANATTASKMPDSVKEKLLKKIAARRDSLKGDSLK